MMFNDVMSHEINKNSREALMVPDDTAGCGRCLMAHRTFNVRKWLNYSALREPTVVFFYLPDSVCFSSLVFR